MVENLKALAVFAKTVECGSFREAARALSLSPSVVSHHVTELERRLALTLLYRTTRRLALTPDGDTLFQGAREMLAAAERSLDAVSGRAPNPAGRLRVTAPALLAETAFCRDLAAFAREHPHVSLTVGFTEQRRELLRDGLDLALRIGPLDDSSLRVRQLTVMPRVLVAAPKYVEGRARPKALRDLERWDFIQLSALRPELSLVPPGRKRPVTLAFRPRVAVDSATAMREMAIAGLGAACLPELVARRDLAQRRLVEVMPGWRPPEIGVHAVWPGGTARPALTLRFVDFMQERLRALFRVEPVERPSRPPSRAPRRGRREQPPRS